MSLNPEHAWQSALDQLQMEMPKASFDSWVRDTQFVSYQDGLFAIGVRNANMQEWLQSRLASTITRMLMGMMNREVSVTFVIDTPAFTKNEIDGESEPELETAEVQIVHKLRYDKVVIPERVVALPGYFSRLIPEIGARNAWLYVGWRQAVWDGQRQDNGSRTRRIPVRQIIRFSGLSRRTFFRAVEDPSTWEALSGLVERSDDEPCWSQGKDRRAHRLPNRYTVHMTLPLSRTDAIAVRHWLADRMQEGVSLPEALVKANQVQDLTGELLPPVRLPTPDTATYLPRTVMEIVGQLAHVEGELSPELQKTSEALHHKIISAFGTILLTHYFIEAVIPKAGLTPAQAWLVALLRDRCYVNRDTGEVRDEVLVHGGYTSLAVWLGLDRPKTAWEWIHEDRCPVSSFVCVLPGLDRDEADFLRLRVRLDEPLFDGMSDTPKTAQVSPFDGADDTITSGANGTHRMAEMAPMDGALGTHSWREWHGLKHLNTDSSTQERITTTTLDATVEVPVSWNLKRILVQCHVHPRVMNDLVAKNASVQAFVSWLLYTCGPAGEGIKNPLAYSLASLREDPARSAGSIYDWLAALPPVELVQLIRWSVKRASNKYSLAEEPSGNETWDKTMGASEHHAILLEILLGEGNATRLMVDGEKARARTEGPHTNKSFLP